MSEAKRVHPPSKATKKAEDYHGSARFERISPDPSAFKADDKAVVSLNVHFSFEEALKLSLALQSCLINVNKFHRGDSEGKRMGVELTIHTTTGSVKVIEKSVTPKRAKDA